MAEVARHELGVAPMLSVVVGSIIGAGIFMLPVTLAPLGWNAAVGWLISGAGALCLAFALARLARGGKGIQAHIEEVFGPTIAFVAAWAFWCGNWTSTAFLALAAGSALSRIDGRFADAALVTPVAISFVVLLTGVNALGIRSAGRMQMLTTAIKVVPLLAVLLILLLRSSRGEAVQALPAIPITFDKVATAAALTLFALTGFEMATTLVGKVHHPTRTLPIAMLGGTAFVAMLYLLSSTAVPLLLSAQATMASPAPFADALASEWGDQAVRVAALCIAISAFGCLNSGILGSGELGYAMAVRGDLPQLFARTRSDGTPVYSQCLAGALGVGLILLSSGRGTVSLFTFIILVATIGTLVLYFIGTLASLVTTPGPLARAAIIVAAVFGLFAFYGSGWEANAWGLLLIVLGLVVRTATRLSQAKQRLASAM
jgi:APA family basic amino acid/polyamine antiporter